MTDAHLDRMAPDKTLKGWHVFLIMLGFFGVMFSVNGVFLYHAIASFPGEDVKKSYVQGLNYNDTLAARATQENLGWQAEAGLQSDGILVRLMDADARPLSQQIVIGEVRRLATQERDLALALRPRGNGEYFAAIDTLPPGQWLLRAHVLDAAARETMFEFEKTLTVR